MQRIPRNPRAPVLGKLTTAILIIQAFTMALLSFGVYMISRKEIILQDAMTLAFTTLTTMQLLQGFLSRTLYESLFKTGILGNKVCKEFNLLFIFFYITINFINHD
jgi:P-type Ca2+ transporter type 2C